MDELIEMLERIAIALEALGDCVRTDSDGDSWLRIGGGVDTYEQNND